MYLEHNVLVFLLPTPPTHLIRMLIFSIKQHDLDVERDNACGCNISDRVVQYVVVSKGNYIFLGSFIIR